MDKIKDNPKDKTHKTKNNNKNKDKIKDQDKQKTTQKDNKQKDIPIGGKGSNPNDKESNRYTHDHSANYHHQDSRVNNHNNLRIPPYSLEAEQSVLGGLMQQNTAWECVSEILTSEDFYHIANRLIFAAIESLANRDQGFDLITLPEMLKLSQQLEKIGGEAYLSEIMHNTPSAANIKAYAEIVREKSILRQLITAGTSIIESAYLPYSKSANDLLDEAEQKIFQIAQRQRGYGSGPIQIGSLLNSAVSHVDKLCHSGDSITGLATGYKDLDDLTLGLQSADLVVIAGRPSSGKTAFAMNIAERAAVKTKQPVLVFSMEMPGEALAIRMMSSQGSIDLHSIRSGKLKDQDWNSIRSAVNILSPTKLFIDDSPALSPIELRTRARRMIREHGNLALIVVDYLQLMQASGFRDNRVGEISEISRSLKALAKELHVPVIALSQLNRGLEQRDNKRPRMSDLRESGAIEQDADLIMFIYRDEVYNKDTQDKGVAEINLSKHRNGETGTVKLTFLGKFTKFVNYSPETFVR